MAKCANLIAHPIEYQSWVCMKIRCKDPAKKKWYGHVTICPAWHFFELFFRDMGPAPSSDHTLDRIKNELGYFKDNCRWATDKEQANNRTNNVPYHVHFNKASGYWFVREYKDGQRILIDKCLTRSYITEKYGV